MLTSFIYFFFIHNIHLSQLLSLIATPSILLSQDYHWNCKKLIFLSCVVDICTGLSKTCFSSVSIYIILFTTLKRQIMTEIQYDLYSILNFCQRCVDVCVYLMYEKLPIKQVILLDWYSWLEQNSNQLRGSRPTYLWNCNKRIEKILLAFEGSTAKSRASAPAQRGQCSGTHFELWISGRTASSETIEWHE